MKNFETLTEAMAALRKDGYVEDFIVKTDVIQCENGVALSHDQFHIDEFYRFEGATDPDDEMILYAISSHDKKTKGLLVNAYGVYEDSITGELLKKLEMKH